MRALGAVLRGAVVVAAVTVAILYGAAWAGRIFRIRLPLPDRLWRRLAHQQPIRRLLILVAVALLYVTVRVSWMPWRDTQRAALATTVGLLVLFEVLLGPPRNPLTMRRPTNRPGQRSINVTQALARGDPARAILAATARPARRFRRSTTPGRWICGAPTAAGGTCRRHVGAPGRRCYQHSR